MSLRVVGKLALDVLDTKLMSPKASSAEMSNAWSNSLVLSRCCSKHPHRLELNTTEAHANVPNINCPGFRLKRLLITASMIANLEFIDIPIDELVQGMVANVVLMAQQG